MEKSLENVKKEILLLKALDYLDDTEVRLAARLEVKRLWEELYNGDQGWKTLIKL